LFDYRPPHTDPRIIYQDDALLIIDKQPELLSVPGRRPEHHDCLISRVQRTFPEALIVHRLDMSTSGLMVLARGFEVHRLLSRQFEQRLVKKNYLAVVSGRLAEPVGRIDLPLICDWPNRPRQMVDQQQGKPAQTNYRLLSYDPASDCSRVKLIPLTGRTHQLRVHMQALGHPILGDDMYADDLTFNKADRLLLHASGLKFTHPTSGKIVIFHQDAPF